MNIIADVAGQYDALMKLIDKMPKDDTILMLGDLNDRGPKTKEVIEWAMKDPRVKALKGNHEDMMTDFFDGIKFYHHQDFLNNGGVATLESYLGKHPSKVKLEEVFTCVPKEHLLWLKTRPLFYEDETLIATHAPLYAGFKDIEDATGRGMMEMYFNVNMMWNRSKPIKRDKFQVFGHMGHDWGLTKFEDWGICLDDSTQGFLTGMHWPSREIFQERFLEETHEDSTNTSPGDSPGSEGREAGNSDL